MFLVKESELVLKKVLSAKALMLFKALNEYVFDNNVLDYTVAVNIYDMADMISTSHDSLIKIKQELIDKGLIVQIKVPSKMNVYKLEGISYDILLRRFLDYCTCFNNEFNMGSNVLLNTVKIFDNVDEFNRALSFLNFRVQEEMVRKQEDCFSGSGGIAVASEYELVCNVAATNYSKSECNLSASNCGVGGSLLNNIPKPIKISGVSTCSNSVTEEITESRKGVFKVFEEVKKPVEKWNTRDFVDYYKFKFFEQKEFHCTVNKATYGLMFNLIKRIGKEETKKQIRNFFMLIASGVDGFNFDPSWNLFFSSKIQSSLDTYRTTGKVVDCMGREVQKNINLIRVEEALLNNAPEKQAEIKEKEEVKAIINKLGLFLYSYSSSLSGKKKELSEDYIQEMEKLLLDRGLDLYIENCMFLDYALNFLLDRGYPPSKIREMLKERGVEKPYIRDTSLWLRVVRFND